MALSAHQFPGVYEALGIDLRTLGCIMLDVEPLPVSALLAKLGIQPYTSPDTAKFWIRGAVADETAHATLLYGLLKTGPEWRDHVDTVLAGWAPDALQVDHVGYFGSPYPDEPYWCIVAHLIVTDNLAEGNARLAFLPHVNTFAGYRPHVTLAYISGTEAERDAAIAALNVELAGARFPVAPNLNYGGNHG